MIKQTRIHDLPETTYDEDYVLAVDNAVSGAGSISLKGVMDRAMEYIGETTVDMPEDPASSGYKMMMTRRFKDAVTDRDFVQIDIESPSAFTGSGSSRNIDLPVILNLSAATITASA